MAVQRMNGGRVTRNVLFALLALLVALGLVYFFLQKKEGFTDGSKGKVFYYYMNGCPHCEDFDPVWAEFIKKDAVKAYQVEKIEANDPKKPKEVTGFPTVHMIDANGKVKEYTGPRTVDGLLAALP